MRNVRVGCRDEGERERARESESERPFFQARRDSSQSSARRNTVFLIRDTGSEDQGWEQDKSREWEETACVVWLSPNVLVRKLRR